MLGINWPERGFEPG